MNPLLSKSFTKEEILTGAFVDWGLSIAPSLPLYRQKSEDTKYRARLRSIVRGLWSSNISIPTFMIAFGNAINRAFDAAWADGMRACGLTLQEATVEEKQALQEYKRQEFVYAQNFAIDISNHTKALGYKLTPLLDRVDMWVNRLNYIRVQAKTRACADMKGIWELGATEQHCRDCARYAGRVYRFSVWRKYLAQWDALPQGRGLACMGFLCQCKLTVSMMKLTPGFPPKPLGPVVSKRRGRKDVECLKLDFASRLSAQELERLVTYISATSGKSLRLLPSKSNGTSKTRLKPGMENPNST